MDKRETSHSARTRDRGLKHQIANYTYKKITPRKIAPEYIENGENSNIYMNSNLEYNFGGESISNQKPQLVKNNSCMAGFFSNTHEEYFMVEERDFDHDSPNNSDHV